MKKKIISILVLTVALLAPAVASAAQTAMQVLTRTSELLKRAEGVTVSFTMTVGGKSMKGTLRSAGRSFSITTPAMGAWYDGKTMWTYNPRTEETTVTIPTPEEIAETNPLVLIASNAGNFTASYSRTQPKSGKEIVLVPKTRTTGIKTLTVLFSTGSQYPSRIVMTASNGQKTIVSINSVDTKAKLTPADFAYPKSKYPKAQIVDLR